LIHRFAVFGDIHGRIALMLVLARAWQRHHGVMLDGILQVGDMGAYPDHGRLDRATLKHAQHDADELGYVAFLTETPDAERFLEDDATPTVAFCRGNHEDFDHLAELHEPTAVDPYGKLVFIPDGHVLTWPRADDAAPLRIGAFGGAPPGDGNDDRRAKRASHLGPHFDPAAVARAFKREASLDILMTHAGPEVAAFPQGSPDLTRLAERLTPRAHLFGHHHEVVGPVATPSGLLVGLEHLEFVRGSLRRGSWGILEIDEAARFSRVEVETDPWLHEVSWSTYRDRDGDLGSIG
jgi:hypothetical protein